MSTGKRVRVWDRFVRVCHWGLVLSYAIAYFSIVGSQAVHNWAGYTALALVALRVVWGFIGSKHARFDDFVPGPRRLWNYTRASLTREAPRHLGHNPAGASMMVFLLCMTAAISVTGWMLTLDAFFGSETVEDLHVALFDITLIALALHVAGALYESWNHRENLIWSMVTGVKRAPTDEDVTHGPPPSPPEVSPVHAKEGGQPASSLTTSPIPVPSDEKPAERRPVA